MSPTTLNYRKNLKKLWEQNAKDIQIVNNSYNQKTLETIEAFEFISLSRAQIQPKRQIRIIHKPLDKGEQAYAIGQQIRKLRLQQQLTQEALAAKCNIERSNLARVESGMHMPATTTIQMIARALNCSIENLMIAPDAGNDPGSDLFINSGLHEWIQQLENEDR